MRPLERIVPGPTFEEAPCPRCGGRALRREDRLEPIGPVRCAACGLRADAVAEVVVDANRVRASGGCCGAGFRHHDLSWHTADEHAAGHTRFETWAQDRVLVERGDRVSLVFRPGEAAVLRGRAPMPYLVVDHDRGDLWRLRVP